MNAKFPEWKQLPPLEEVIAATNFSFEDRWKAFARLISSRPQTEAEFWKAALLVFPSPLERGHAHNIVTTWRNNIVVIRELELCRKDQPGFLPDKDQLAQAILKIAEDPTGTRTDQLKAYAQYADLMGFTPKNGGINVNVNNTVGGQRRVFALPVVQDADSWEEETVAQQAKLIGSKSTSDDA